MISSHFESGVEKCVNQYPCIASQQSPGSSLSSCTGSYPRITLSHNIAEHQTQGPHGVMRTEGGCMYICVRESLGPKCITLSARLHLAVKRMGCRVGNGAIAIDMCPLQVKE